MPRGDKRPHPFQEFGDNKNHKGETFTHAEKYQKCIDYVTSEAKLPNCINRTNTKSGTPCACSCLHVLDGKEACIEAVARYLMHFHSKGREAKYETIMGWYRYTRNLEEEGNSSRRIPAKVYLVPFIHEKNTDGDVGAADDIAFLAESKVCANAIGNLLDWGQTKWKETKRHVRDNTLPTHGNKGKKKTNTKFNQEVKEDLKFFFKYLFELAQPRATLFVREETGTGLRDDDEELRELPTSFSKRGLYTRFCNERGWLVDVSPRGETVLKEDDSFQQERKPVCHWTSFYNFWDKEYPKLKLSNAAKDVCGECYVYRNQSKDCELKDASLSKLYCLQVGALRCISPDRPNQRTVQLVQEHLASSTDPSEHLEEVTEREQRIIKAAKHVKQAIAQRELANRKIAEAIQDEDNKVPHSQRRYVFIFDFCQNMQLPFFGQEQPGETYYFSPLNINVFGVVPYRRPGGELAAHVYTEGQGKKGGDNVASLFMKELLEQCILRDDEVGGELTVIMDNCAGQNKNNMVLRLAAYLVEAGYFKKVTFMFYIVGHTKNAADRWFNLLKKKYRRSNVYSFREMLEMMDEHPGVSVRAVEPNDFRAWGEYLDKYYKKFESGTVLPNHIFTVTDDAVSTMIIKEDNMPTTVARAPQNLRKGRDKTTCRKETLRSDQPTIIPFGTIQPIKQVELFSKFRPLIPKKYQDETCPYPGDKIMNEIRVTKNAKAKERAAKKRKKNSKPSEKKKKEKKEKEMKKSLAASATATAC